MTSVHTHSALMKLRAHRGKWTLNKTLHYRGADRGLGKDEEGTALMDTSWWRLLIWLLWDLRNKTWLPHRRLNKLQLNLKTRCLAEELVKNQTSPTTGSKFSMPILVLLPTRKLIATFVSEGWQTEKEEFHVSYALPRGGREKMFQRLKFTIPWYI